MKQLMLGNAAVARGLYEAGCCVISSYPGTPSTEITEEAAKFDDIYCEWAPNEKVAMEVAFGASLAGKRSFCAMKHVGLNVAADPLFTVAYTGVNAGMVIAVADDPGMHSSQNEQDSRHYAIAAKLPMLEPADSAEALAFTRRAYEISEEFDTPVILKMCTRVAHSQSIVETSPRTEGPERPYEKNIAKYVMMPGNAIRRHPVVEDRMRRLAQYAETCDLNRVEMGDTKLGIITSSTSYQYVKEVFGEEASVLKLGMVHPMPEGLIRDFAAKVDRLVVVEELDPRGEVREEDKAFLADFYKYAFVGLVLDWIRTGMKGEPAELARRVELVVSGSFAQALERLRANPDVKVALLDIMLPGIDGFEVCRRIRATNTKIGIIMLTARSQEMDKVTGLMTGADDYVTKPFSPAELTARVDALFRRAGGEETAQTGEISQPPFLLNVRNRTLEKNGQRVKLTQVEYAIMRVFMENPGKALSREEILDRVWGRDYFGELKIVDVNIRRLRLKIEDNVQNPTYITTVWGYGYKWGA